MGVTATRPVDVFFAKGLESVEDVRDIRPMKLFGPRLHLDVEGSIGPPNLDVLVGLDNYRTRFRVPDLKEAADGEEVPIQEPSVEGFDSDKLPRVENGWWGVH